MSPDEELWNELKDYEDELEFLPQDKTKTLEYRISHDVSEEKEGQDVLP